MLSTAAVYFCVIADNDFLNDPHNLIYSRILLMISLCVPVPWPCMSVVSVLNHILGGHQKHSNAEKNLKNLVLKIDFDLVFLQNPCLSQWISNAKTKIWDKCPIKRKIRRERQREKRREKSVGKSQKKNKSTRILLGSVTPASWPLASWWK